MYLEEGVEHLDHGLDHDPGLLHPLSEDGRVHQHPQRVPAYTVPMVKGTGSRD